jgi:hypothetical protein
MLGLFLAVQFLPALINQSIILHQNFIAKNIQKHKNNIVLSFTYQEWQELKKVRADEIEINGKLFDIQSLQKSKDQIVIYGHYDTKEDQLKELSQDLKKKSKQIEKQNVAFSLLFCETPITYSFFNPQFKSNQPILKPSQLCKLFLQASSPPPKV